MARIDLSTIGMRLGYAVETEAGTMPSAFTWLKGAKSLPEMNSEPETIESTTFDELQFRTYIDGLQDTGGALAIGFNQTEDLLQTWDKVYSDYSTAKADNKSTWWVFWHPGLSKSFFFRGNPSQLGWGGAEVNALLETNVYVTPVGDIGWKTAIEPTEAVGE